VLAVRFAIIFIPEVPLQRASGRPVWGSRIIVWCLVRISERERERVLHGKERRRSHDVPGCLPALPAHGEASTESLHPLGDPDVHPYGGHRRLPAMVPRVHGAPLAIPFGSREKHGEGRAEAAGRQAVAQAAAGALLLRMSASMRDRPVNVHATRVTARKTRGSSLLETTR